MTSDEEGRFCSVFPCTEGKARHWLDVVPVPGAEWPVCCFHADCPKLDCPPLKRVAAPIRGDLRVAVVSVTAEDIRLGEPNQCGACPWALALGRVVAPGTRVRVLTDDVEFWLPGGASAEADLPPGVAPWIMDFDDRCDVEPMSASFMLPKAVLP